MLGGKGSTADGSGHLAAQNVSRSISTDMMWESSAAIKSVFYFYMKIDTSFIVFSKPESFTNKASMPLSKIFLGLVFIKYPY
jgi:hypothetical protein